MTSTGKGRMLRSGWVTAQSLRQPTFQETINGGIEAVTNDYWWGGFPPEPTEIPYAWLTPPARWRSDQPRTLAVISRANGGAAAARDPALIAAVGERPFTATLDTRVVDDPANYAGWILGNYTEPRQRMPQLRLNLTGRSPTECWRILEREIGDRISITGAPGSSSQLLSNPWFESGSAPWSAQNGSVAQSALFPRSGSNSLLLTPTGGISVVNALSETVPISAGASYVTSAWVLAPLGWAGGTSTGMNWYAGTSFVTTQFGTPVTLVAGVMTQLPVETFVAPAGVDGGQLRIRMAGMPANTDLLYLDEAMVSGPDGRTSAWPDGVTELVIEGIAHSISGDTRFVIWNTAPLIGADPGEAGPWFRADQSTTDIGSDLLAF